MTEPMFYDTKERDDYIRKYYHGATDKHGVLTYLAIRFKISRTRIGQICDIYSARGESIRQKLLVEAEIKYSKAVDFAPIDNQTRKLIRDKMKHWEKIRRLYGN